MFALEVKGNEIFGSYDYEVVFLSYVIAALLSFMVLDLSERIRESQDYSRKLWIGVSALCMGGGIWSMHFTGMLAFKLPVEVSYNIPITLLSLILVILFSAVAFFQTLETPPTTIKVFKMGILTGLGISVMHYSGMAAMQMPASMVYFPPLFALSILIAMGAATITLWIMSRIENNFIRLNFWKKMLTALIMGLAIFGMHYTGMAATHYITPEFLTSEPQPTQDARLLGFTITGLTLIILGLAIFASRTQSEFFKLIVSRDELEHLVQERTKDLNLNIEKLQEEITYRKDAELKIQKAMEENLKVAGQVEQKNKVLEMIALGNSLEQTLSTLLKDTESQLGNVRCSILILDKSGKNLHKGAGPSLPDSFSNAIDGFEIGPNVGACGSAAFKNETVIIEDISTDPKAEKFKDLAISHNLRACWSSPIRNTNGKVLGTLCPYFDEIRRPTEREQEIVLFAAYLSGIAIQLKQTENQLRESKEEAEKANQAKSEFLSRMSHELRTPMNAILGFTQLMEMDKQNPLIEKQKKSLHYISTAGNHLLNLINEVLDLSRVESGKVTLNLESVNLTDIAGKVISISKPLLDKKDISLNFQDITKKDYFVEADPVRLNQILLNLISNAIKYNKPGGSITLSFAKQEENIVRFGIRDTGRGIARKEMDRIFKPFERIYSKSEEIEGTGVGLAISKQLIEMMGGTIGVESEPQKGSYFYIDLQASQNLKEVSYHASVVNTLPTFPNTKNRKKLLYIDDLENNIELLEKILLNRPEFKLLTASNALDGIKIAKEDHPDLILMDIQMPNIDGITAFKILNTENETQNIPVVAVTADAMASDVKKALDIGFHSCITKPINIVSFLKTIDGILYD